MEREDRVVALPPTEVPMIEPETVRLMRELCRRGWGPKRIARELCVARNTVKRYLRGGDAAAITRSVSRPRSSRKWWKRRSSREVRNGFRVVPQPARPTERSAH